MLVFLHLLCRLSLTENTLAQGWEQGLSGMWWVSPCPFPGSVPDHSHKPKAFVIAQPGRAAHIDCPARPCVR